MQAPSCVFHTHFEEHEVMGSCKQEMTTSGVIDLHELATIFLYEALSTEPRFRHGKLIEVAPNGAFQGVFLDKWSPEWHKLGFNKNNKSTSIGYVLEKRQYDTAEERDTPFNMVDWKSIPTQRVSNLSEDDRELIFHQTRLHVRKTSCRSSMKSLRLASKNGCNRLNQMFERYAAKRDATPHPYCWQD